MLITIVLELNVIFWLTLTINKWAQLHYKSYKGLNVICSSFSQNSNVLSLEESLISLYLRVPLRSRGCGYPQI